MPKLGYKGIAALGVRAQRLSDQSVNADAQRRRPDLSITLLREALQLWPGLAGSWRTGTGHIRAAIPPIRVLAGSGEYARDLFLSLRSAVPKRPAIPSWARQPLPRQMLP
jgi:hypothetical protein